MRSVGPIARRLLWQNRWLFLLLALWPFIMAAILLAAGTPDPDDVLWMLHQECFAGLALVAVTGSTLLGNEQRSRRIVTVLSRAVSRPVYLFALLVTAWLPLVLYASGFLLAGVMLARSTHQPWNEVFEMAVLQLLLGAWAGAVSILWSVLLPQLIASLVSVLCVALATYAGSFGFPGASRLFASLISGPAAKRAGADVWLDAVLTLIAAAIWFGAASWVFTRRDLNLAAD